jgi:hypothetical protein
MRRLLVDLLLTGILMVVSLAGCGSSSIKRTSTIDFQQAERDQWNAYTPAEQQQYRQAFKLCDDWSTGPSAFKQSEGPTEAADFFIAHDLFNTPLGAGCGDGIANTPLSGSR